MSVEPLFEAQSFERLNHRRLEIWPRRAEDPIALRMRRATSWLQRAEMSMAAGVDEGYDSACIFTGLLLTRHTHRTFPGFEKRQELDRD